MAVGMRKALLGVALLGCVFSTSEAHAQFANRSVGLSPGFFKLFAPDVNWMVPLTLDGSFYAENGFDIFVHAPVAISSIRAVDSTGAANPNYITFGWGLQIGARYLFLEESIRPYVGLQVSAIFILRDPNPVLFYAGPGVTGGVDFFASDTFSIGPRVFYDFFIGVADGQVTLRHQLGGALNFSVYF